MNIGSLAGNGWEEGEGWRRGQLVEWVTRYNAECSHIWVWAGRGIMGSEGWLVNGRALVLMDWLNLGYSPPSAAPRDHLNLRSSLSHLQHALEKRKWHYSTTNIRVYSEIIIIDIMYLPGVPGCTGGKVGRDAREGGELPEYGYWSFVYFFLFATLKAQTLDVIQFLPKALPAN